jgi:hypothetical protein
LPPVLLEALDLSLHHDPRRVGRLTSLEHPLALREHDALGVVAEPVEILVGKALEDLEGAQLLLGEPRGRRQGASSRMTTFPMKSPFT